MRRVPKDCRQDVPDRPSDFRRLREVEPVLDASFIGAARKQKRLAFHVPVDVRVSDYALSAQFATTQARCHLV